MMIDLETLDTKVLSVVVSGAFVVFDRESPDYIELISSSSKFTFDRQIRLGRTISEDTIRWHIQHPTETFVGKAESYVEDFAEEIKDSIFTLDIEEVWSKGANFDISILETIMPGLWSYKLPRCFRTIQALFPGCNKKNPLAHNALEDARDQAKELWRITQKYLMPKT